MGRIARKRAGWVAGLLLALALSSCGGDSSGEDDGGGGNEGTPVKVTGNFTGGAHSVLWRLEDFFWRLLVKTAHALDSAQVAKVIFFSRQGTCRTAEVSSGTFSVDVSTKTSSGLLFLGSDNKQLGYLSLGNGIDSLPLMDVKTTSIDLSTLSSASTVVSPGTSPIGTAILLSNEEKIAIAHGNTAFASVVKNGDADGDGTVDCLQSRFYAPNFMYFIDGGSFQGKTKGVFTTPASIKSWIFAFSASSDENPADSSVVFNGPLGSNLTNNTCCYYKSGKFREASPVSNPAIPPGGDYKVTFGSRTLTFTMASQAQANNNVVLAVPTVTVDGNGGVQKISWAYKLGSGSNATLDAADIIDKIEAQFDGNRTPCPEAKGGGNRLYDSGFVDPAVTEHTVTCSSLKWADVTSLYMAYDDLFGNHYVVTWQKN